MVEITHDLEHIMKTYRDEGDLDTAKAYIFVSAHKYVKTMSQQVNEERMKGCRFGISALKTAFPCWLQC